MWSGEVWESRGVIRQAEGDPDQARALFREAGEAFGDEGRKVGSKESDLASEPHVG